MNPTDVSIKILSGYKLTQEEFDNLWNVNISFDHQIINDFVYVGQILFIGYRGDSLSIELLRDWSTTDIVRNVRFALMKLNPEKFNDIFPQMFTI